MHMRICMHAHLHKYMCIWVYVHIYICMHKCMYLCVDVYVYICTCAYMKQPSIPLFRLLSIRSLLRSYYSGLPELFIVFPHI